MVCKEDVLTWFRDLSGHKRIDVMCSLLDKCLPMELRFFGTCLEDLGKQHFNQMKDFEVKANNPTELSELLVQCIISDTRTRQKLALYICLVHSLNTTCSLTLYKTLSTLDFNRILPITNATDEKLLEELLLIYTIAINHPVFTYEQKAVLGNILLSLRQAEEELQTSKPEELNEEYVTAALNLSAPGCQTETTPCSEVPSHNIPHGLTVRLGGQTRNYIPPFPYPPYPPIQQIPHHSLVGVWSPYSPLSIETLVQDGAVSVNTSTAQFTSPHISRQSSPSQSASPSRTASPVRKNFYKGNHQSNTRQNFVDSHFHITSQAASKMSNLEPFDAPRDSKDLGIKHEEDLRGLNDRKMTDLNLEESQTLGSAVVNINGIVDSEHLPTVIRQKPGFDSEATITCTPSLPRPLDSNIIGTQPPPIVPAKPCCLAAGMGPGYPQVYCQHNLQGLNLDNEGSRHYSSSSGSDASSTSHSPPSTPANPIHSWDKVYPEVSNPDKILRSIESAESQTDDSGKVGIHPKLDRSHLHSVRGRSRTNNPPGVQTLPRGRGPHSNIMDSTQKTIMNSRRDGPRSAPPTPHEDKKCYIQPTSEISPVVTSSIVSPIANQAPTLALPLPAQPSPLASQQTAGAGKPPPPPPPSHELVAGGVPYTQPFLTTHYSPVYPPYHPAAFVRSNFAFTNGDVIYPYQPSFVPPVVYSPSIPPPKISCYNCSSQSHHASECKEPTMEEYTSKGQYRIDYKPYNNKVGEFVTEK